MNDSRVSFVRADISDRRKMDEVIKAARPSAVLNFAAETHVDRSIDDPGAFIQTNVVGVYVLLEACRAYLKGLTEKSKRGFRFLHVSTDEVYGSLGARGAFREDSPYAPNSPYSASKAGADHLVRAYCETYRFPGLITNCSNNYGPYQFPEKLIPLMILNAMEGKPLPVYGDGKNVRDWLYVEDHCDGILLALKRGRVGGKYNIGGRNEHTNIEIVKNVCAIVEKQFPAKKNNALISRGFLSYKELVKFVPDRPGHDRRYAIDAGKIRRELGWKPRFDFAKGLAHTVRWYLDNAKWCRTVQSGKYGRERLGLKK
jgi:dTDP-glucose 4,6-dehydratase